MREDQVRFKNLLNQALVILKNRNESSQLIEFINDRSQQLQSDKAFWEDQAEGLLLCIRPDHWAAYNLPIDTEEYLAIDDHFHLAPIYAYLSDQQTYYVLALAQHAPKLYEGDLYQLQASDAELPASIEEALNIDEMHQRSVQYHTNTNKGGAGYHGHGGIKDAGESERLRYFRMIDDILANLPDVNRPLLLAATESEVVEYKRTARYPLVMPAALHGNYVEMPPNQLHKFVRPIIERDIIMSKHQAVIDRFARLAGANQQLVATGYAAIKDAAEKGRVDTLALGMSRKTRDTVGDNQRAVTKLVFSGPADNKLLDYIAQLVWSQSGKIVNLYQDQMPAAGPMFAIMRY